MWSNNYRKAVVEGEEVDPAMDKLVKSLTQHTPTSPQPTSMFLREAFTDFESKNQHQGRTKKQLT